MFATSKTKSRITNGLSSGSARDCSTFFVVGAARRTRQVFWVEVWRQPSWIMEDWQDGPTSCQMLDRLRSILPIMISPSAKDCTEILPRRSYEIWHRSCIIGRYDILRLTLVWWNGDTFTGDPYEDLYTLWRLDETCHPRVVCCLLPKQLRSTIPIHGHFPNSVVWANFY